MSSRLPPTKALQAFDTAARHLSFTRAAQQLSLSQTAISHQIKSLENALGAPLFFRHPNGLQLTEIGREYLDRVRPALAELSAATDRAKDFNDERSLVVATLGTFSVKCLMPKLPDFRLRHRSINLKLVIVDSFDRLDPGAFDIGFRYGHGDWPRMRVDRITREEAFPVCSPALLPEGRKWTSPKDLLSQTLIRLDSAMLGDFWLQWLETAGIRNAKIGEDVRCNRLSASIQAAINGMGVAIARSSVAKPDLDAGLIVEPFDLRIPTGREGYFLISPQEKAESRKVSIFREWVIDSFGKVN